MNHESIKIALQFMKFRPRTVFEVEEKLKSKGIAEREIKETIATLKKAALLDDEKFAKMYIDNRNLLRPSGKYLLKIELKKLGLTEEIIEENLKNQNEEELARHAIESKAKYRNSDFNHQAQFLQRRGFSTGLIYKILKERDKQ